MAAADEPVGQRVVDDARVAHEDDHRAGGDVVQALDLEAQSEEALDAVQVPADPALAQVVDAEAARAAVAPGRREPDRRQAREPAQLAQQELPQERDEPHADELPVPGDDAREVDDGRGGEEQRERHRDDDNATSSMPMVRTRRCRRARRGPRSGSSGPMCRRRLRRAGGEHGP